MYSIAGFENLLCIESLDVEAAAEEAARGGVFRRAEGGDREVFRGGDSETCEGVRENAA